MSQDTRVRMIVIIVLTVFFGYLLAPIPNKPVIPGLQDARMKLGIDLAGGAELRYRVLFPTKVGIDTQAITRQACDVIRHRVEQRKLKEPRITTQDDDQIIIQLAGVDRTVLEDYRKLIEQAGKLELFASASKEIQERYNIDKKVPEGFRAWPNDEPLRSPSYEHFSHPEILLSTKTVIEGTHIANAGTRQQLATGGGIMWTVTFELTPDGAKLFDEAAAELHKQKPSGLIAIVLDGKIISTPTVESDSFGGSGVIRGNFDDESARNLAIILRSGSLPVPIGSLDLGPRHAESENFVGPTLGQDAIRRGVMASSLSLILVAIFMIVYYRSAGVIAIISLALNIVFLLGIMSFFGATLTLPGIAGIALTVGMAVDANILILERIREEQAKGKTAIQSCEAGHERAFSAIVDSNITTLVAAIVMYYFGTGPVQGFAVTLSIGIATTLFSVLFCGKTLLWRSIAGGRTEFRMMRLFSSPNLDYLRPAKAFVAISAIILIAGTTFFLKRGDKNFGIDFRGGSTLSFGLQQDQDIQLVRSKIQSIPGPDGLPKYGDAEIQTVADPTAESARLMMGQTASRFFQMFTSSADIVNLKNDVQNALAGLLSHEPFGEMGPEEVDSNPRLINGGPAGPGWYIYLREGTPAIDQIREKIANACKDMLERDAEGKAAFHLEELAERPAGVRKLKLQLSKRNSTDEGGDLRRRVRDTIQTALQAEISSDPFTSQGRIGPQVASDLRDKTIWAMMIAWALMIAYIAIRFASWRYGAAAVLALVHDAIIAIAVTSLAGAIVPKSWGLSFAMNLTTMAAILTVIGFSINDTIVIFDRIRENLILMKKATFAEVINTSVNQTMSRTILTSFTVWMSCVALYLFTATTGGGIAEFSFPLIFGVIAGTYSTIWIACPVVYWWYKGQRPATS